MTEGGELEKSAVLAGIRRKQAESPTGKSVWLELEAMEKVR